MLPNRTSMWKVMTIWISREVLLFNFQCLDILCLQIGRLYDYLNFSRGSVVQFQASRYIMRLNRTSVVQFRVSRYIMLLNRTSMWKVMTIGTAQGHPLFHFKRLYILCPRIVHSCEKLWPLKILESFCCSISSFSIYYVPELYIRVKSYDHLNFSRGFVVQFLASRYIMPLNRTSVWKVMTIWISWQVPLFIF